MWGSVGLAWPVLDVSQLPNPTCHQGADIVPPSGFAPVGGVDPQHEQTLPPRISKPPPFDTTDSSHNNLGFPDDTATSTSVKMPKISVQAEYFKVFNRKPTSRDYQHLKRQIAKASRPEIHPTKEVDEEPVVPSMAEEQDQEEHLDRESLVAVQIACTMFPSAQLQP